MRKIFDDFIDRYFHDEEAVIFTVILIFMVLILATIGSILSPLIAAVITAYFLQGLVNSLQRFKMAHLSAVMVVYILFISLFISTLFFLLPQAWSQFGRFINELPRLISEAQILLQHLPEKYPNLISDQQVRDFISSIRGELTTFGQYVLTYSISSIPSIFSWIIFLILVPVLVFFMLKDKVALVQWINSLLPRNRPLMSQILREMDMQLANYIRGKVLEIFIVGAVSYICFMVLGINYALLLSVLTGLSVVIPFIGVAVVGIPVAAVAYVQWGMSQGFYMAMLVYTIIQLLDANVLVPVIFSETVNLHPVAIVAAVLFFGGIWGLAGVFFAIPLATFIKAIINAWPSANHVRLDARKNRENKAIESK
ncbi:MAG: AI-2E family transporter [Pseudomonadales bacterium]|nr:AI-2E family transporter [Pseudomonadales bacterium]